jgi:malonyl-CoA/methylmalonyl-CoA synthetase
MSNHLFDVIRTAMPATDHTFIETDDGRRITYESLMTGSARLAHALVSAGVVIGDRVAVQVEKSPAAILLYLACIRAGAIFLPLNSAYTIAELDYFLGDSEPRMIVCDPSKYDAISAIAGTAAVETLDARGLGSLIDSASAHSSVFINAFRAPDDLAAILYTSGTTGRSKGAMLSHDNLASNAKTLCDYWQFSSQDVLLHALPIFHTHGLFVATNVVLMAGASMLFLPKLDPDTIFRLMPRATTMMGVPTFYARRTPYPRQNAAHAPVYLRLRASFGRNAPGLA